MNPKIEITNLAKQTNPNIKVKLLSVSNDKNKMKTFNDELKESIRMGDWVIVQNAHLLKEWSRDTLNLLFVSFDKFKIKILL